MTRGRAPRVLVIGLDGLEPSIVDAMFAAGELPALARLRDRGGYTRLATTFPAQTPVAWSSFATGTNPGGHGIYDFIRRDPATYLPDLSLNRYQQKNAFTPPKAVNLRGGTPFWDLLGRAGVPSTVLRCPCTYPGEIEKGRLLSGLGVPDIRGGLGTPTVWTAGPDPVQRESERVIPVRVEGGVVRTFLPGPRQEQGEAALQLTIRIEAGDVIVECENSPSVRLSVSPPAWSSWVKVKFKLGLLQSAAGMVRYFVPSLQPFTLYASPVNFAPDAPLYPISAPWDYAGELEDALGSYYTTGMVEDHTGLMNGRIDEYAFLAQCALVMHEREAMLQHELARFKAGFLFCLFDTPDRLQHMFWRFGEPDHPANRLSFTGEFTEVIRDHYRECDAVVARALEAVGDDALVIVLSDHGFTSFQRGVHLNGWLLRNGFLALEPGVEPGEAAGGILQHIDWSRTSAYALGLGSIYLNRRGREAQGILDAGAADRTAEDIVAGLTVLIDAERGSRAVERVLRSGQLYRGPFADEAPDLLVLTRKGYRASWATGLGGIPATVFEDNVKRWGGDHIVDPGAVPGVLLMSRPFQTEGAAMTDLATTILHALGVAPGAPMEGRSLI
ncbi:MAG TPA: alkaline phosphatase family protein [Gemmatimonadales bacterium]